MIELTKEQILQIKECDRIHLIGLKSDGTKQGLYNMCLKEYIARYYSPRFWDETCEFKFVKEHK